MTYQDSWKKCEVGDYIDPTGLYNPEAPSRQWEEVQERQLLIIRKHYFEIGGMVFEQRGGVTLWDRIR